MSSIDFHTRYRSATAVPFTEDKTYVNIAPSPLLQPYIRCFWGSACSFNPHESSIYGHILIIPDTCFDLMLIKNHRTGRIKHIFLGLNNCPVLDSLDEQDKKIYIFAVRFPMWAMNCISRLPMEGTLNQAVPSGDIFPSIEELCEKIFEEPLFNRRMLIAEAYIKKLMRTDEISLPFFNGVDYILRQKGTGTLKQLARHLCYSERQVQRIFLDAVGTTPKQLMSLVRYQSVWQELVALRNIDYMNIVCRYGYTDQSHFISDFKKYHSVTPREAVRIMLE